jgi:hypothetical protein
LHVRNVAASVASYRRCGFSVEDTFVPEGATDAAWAWLASGGAHLMIVSASAPVVAEQQAVIFYHLRRRCGGHAGGPAGGRRRRRVWLRGWRTWRRPTVRAS